MRRRTWSSLAVAACGSCWFALALPAGTGSIRDAPDFVATDLPAAIEFILDFWPSLRVKARELAKDLRPGQVVAIGGLARSGKSSIASELKYALRERSIGAVIAPLDNWLRPESEREAGVLGRYDMTRLEFGPGPPDP